MWWKLQGGRFKLIEKNSDDWNLLEMVGLSGRSGGSQCLNATNEVCMPTSLRFLREDLLRTYVLGTVLGTGSKSRKQGLAILVRERDNKHIMPGGDKYYKEK